MKGIIIWAHDNCRSTLGFYIELIKLLDVPAKINIVNEVAVSQREKVGFKADELKDTRISLLRNDSKLALEDLNSHQDWYHLFASYQKCNIFKLLIDYAIKYNIQYAIMSEAPCNMEAKPWRRILKFFYINIKLKYSLRKAIRHADFMVNYSGYYENVLRHIGWDDSKIVPFGYFPPPIPNSALTKRTENNWRNFTILLSGIHQWHRSPMALLKALSILKKKGIVPKCYITQNGPLLDKMKTYAQQHDLSNVEFLGFVSMKRLIELYETCSVYVGAGSNEPWGMRLNDVLQCGAPLIVSRGMGGVKMVDDYKCGLAFDKNDYNGLAQNLETLIKDKATYLAIAENAYTAALSTSPANKAFELKAELDRRFPLLWK